MFTSAAGHPDERSEERQSPAATSTKRPRGPTRGWHRDLLALAAYAALGLIVGWDFWLDVHHRISSHLPTDHTWFEWLLAHGGHSVRHLSNPLFSAQQNAPDGVNIMANTSALGITIPLAPVTLLLGSEVSYLLWLCGGLVATATTSYWVLSRRLVSSRGAAFVGGGFLGFAPGVVHHGNGQPNFVANFLLPLIVARVLRLGEPGRWISNGFILGLLVAYQTFINEELLLITAFGCAVLVAVYAVDRRAEVRTMLRPFLAALGLAAGVAVAIVAYPLWFQFFGPQSFRGVQRGAFHEWGEDPWAYVTFARDTLGGSEAAEEVIGGTEQNTWFGWPLVGLSLLTIVLLWRRSIAVRAAAIVAAVFAFGSLGPRLRWHGVLTVVPGPWAAVPDHLPVIEMLMPARLSFAVVGAVGVLITIAWDQIAREGSRERVLRSFGHGAIALALVPLIPTPLPTMPVAPPPHFITSGAWRPHVAAGHSLVPVPLPSNSVGLATLRWSALSGQEFPIPAGYFIGPDEQGEGMFGTPPRRTTVLLNRIARTGEVPVLGPIEQEQARIDLRYWRASIVVLGPHPRQTQLREAITALLGSATRVDDVWIWRVD